MPNNEHKIQIGNIGSIDWNKLKPGVTKENISEDLNTIWSKIDTSGDGKISQEELEILKADLTQAISDKVITEEEARAYLDSKKLNNIANEKFLQFMFELGGTESDEHAQVTLQARDFGFVNGKLENVEIDARAAGISDRIYNGVVKIPQNTTMPEDGSLPKILMMELPSAYGENQFTKLIYNEADGTYMSRYKDMAFSLEKNEQGGVILRAIDDEQLKMKRAKNLKDWNKGIKNPDTPTPVDPTPIDTIKPKQPIKKPKQDDLGLDNYYGNSFQKSQGDCYLLATINSIRNVSGGQEYLQSLRTEKTVNGEKVYTLKLPGAKLAAKSLKDDNMSKVFITGQYSFTEDEVRDILAKEGERYSKGDPDVILLEAAFEKYREEVQQTLKANNLSVKEYWQKAGMVTGREEHNILSSGWEHDAIFILTGKKSEYYSSSDYDELPILSSVALKDNMALPLLTEYQYKVKSIDEIDGNIRKTDYALNKMLNKIQKDFEDDNKSDLVATASFKIGDSLKDSGGHAFTVKKVTDDEVILINPWYPDRELKMSRKMFREYCKSMTIAKYDEQKSWWQKFKEATGLDSLLG